MVDRTVNVELLARLRHVLAEQPVTEAELRSLSDEADGWLRALRGQVAATERRLDALVRDPTTPLGDLATELRRIDALLPALREASTLVARLDVQARKLRSAWLLAQAEGAAPGMRRPPHRPC